MAWFKVINNFYIHLSTLSLKNNNNNMYNNNNTNTNNPNNNEYTIFHIYTHTLKRFKK